MLRTPGYIAVRYTWLVFAEILDPLHIYLSWSQELSVFSMFKAAKPMESARFLSFGGVQDGSNRFPTEGRTHARQRTGVPGIWPLPGLPMTSAITICLNTAGRTSQGASGREASQP